MKKVCRRMRVRALLCALAVVTCSALSGCSAAGQSGASGSRGGKIFVIGQSEGIQFWDSVEQGARDAAEEFGYEIHYSNAKSISDIDGQISLINDAISQHADAIVIAPNDPNKLDEAVRAASEAGIKIIAIDADFNNRDIRASYIGTNNLTSGKIAGRHAAEAFADPINDKALIVRHSDTASSADFRFKGFMSIVGSAVGARYGEAMAAAAAQAAQAAAMAAATGNPQAAGEDAGGPPADAQGQEGGFSPVAGVMNCKGDVNTAKEQTMQMLQEHPEIKIVFATNESSTLGVCQAIQELDFDPDEINVIGFNSNEAEIQYLRAGILDALVVQNPYNMGYLGVYYAGNLVNGTSIAGNIDTGVTFVTAENIDNDEIQLILDPKNYLAKSNK